MARMRKIRLTRHILVKGEHAQAGDVFSAEASIAAALVGDGSAEYHEDSKDEVEAESKAGVSVREPLVSNADPQIKKISSAPKAADKK